MTTAPTRKRPTSPLLIPAAILSSASFAWTTWSLVGLLGTGLIGVTVAAGADIIWAAVILAEARNLRVANKPWTVPAVGWAALLVVAVLLAWHGMAQHSLAMATAGPFLPLGAKIVWVLALADMRDPAALTDDELHQLAGMERGMAFEEARHHIEMRRRAMGAELLMTEVSTDFDIELMRQDKTRELGRRRPLELTAGEPVEPPAEPRAQKAQPPVEPRAHTAEPEGSAHPVVLASSLAAPSEPPAQPAEPNTVPFGFSGHLTAQSAQRAQQVAKVAELLAQDPGLTSAQVAEELSVSPATAKRYLREARNPSTGNQS